MMKNLSRLSILAASAAFKVLPEYCRSGFLLDTRANKSSDKNVGWIEKVKWFWVVRARPSFTKWFKELTYSSNCEALDSNLRIKDSITFLVLGADMLLWFEIWGWEDKWNFQNFRRWQFFLTHTLVYYYFHCYWY